MPPGLSLRAEAKLRGVTVYQVRIERGKAEGLTPGQSVGHPEPGKLSKTEIEEGVQPLAEPIENKFQHTIQKVFEDPNGMDAERIQKAQPGKTYKSMFIRITASNGRNFSSRTVNPANLEDIQLAIDDINDILERYGVVIAKVEYVYIKQRPVKKVKKSKAKKVKKARKQKP